MQRNKEVVCSSCEKEIGSSPFNQSLHCSKGLSLCLSCFINSSLTKQKKDPNDSHKPTLSRSPETCQLLKFQDDVPRLEDLDLTPCGKHIWTELITQKLNAYSYCHNCSISLCSVCLLSTQHRHHFTSQLCDLFGSSTTQDNEKEGQGVKKRDDVDEATLAKVAKKVISLLSQPVSKTLYTSSSCEKAEPLKKAKARAVKTVCLRDVLSTKSQTKLSSEKLTSISTKKIEEKNFTSPQTDRRKILREKTTTPQVTKFEGSVKAQEKGPSHIQLMSPIIKFSSKKPSSASDKVENGSLPSAADIKPFKPSAIQSSRVVKVKGHCKTLSLAIPATSIFSYEDKENDPYMAKLSRLGSPKPKLKPFSFGGTRRDTPRSSCHLADFSVGIQKAFSKLNNSTALKTLVLNKMGISLHNLQQLVPLMQNYKLSHIDLSSNHLDDACLPLLIELFKKTRIFIDLRGNQFSEEALENFKRTCSLCTVAS